MILHSLKKLKEIRLLCEELQIEFYLAGSLKEGNTHTHSDLDIILIGDNVSDPKLSQMIEQKNINAFRSKRAEIDSTTAQTPLSVIFYHEYFKGGLKNIFIPCHHIIHFNTASFIASSRAYQTIIKENLHHNGQEIEDKVSFLFLKNLALFAGKHFKDDPYQLLNDSPFFFSELKKYDYLLSYDQRDRFQNYIFEELEKIKKELSNSFHNLQSNEAYLKLIEPESLELIKDLSI